MNLQEHYLYQAYYQENRRIRVWLPEAYQASVTERFGVLYLHDGQNVFIDEESYVGHSWRVIEAYTAHHHRPPMIIVGIDNHPEKRLDEYSPWQLDPTHHRQMTTAGGDGSHYGEWVVKVVKPFIDQKYRTLVEVEHTWLAGSSMGGLITAYLAAEYPTVFGKIGVFSLASWFNEGAFLEFIKGHPLAKNTKVYLQVGTEETDGLADPELEQRRNQQYVDCSLNYYATLLAQGVPIANTWLRIMIGEKHHEQYWAQHFGEFIDFMSAN